jgi:hypothetical protein
VIWWYKSIIPALRRVRHKDHGLETSLGYTVKACLKKKKKVVIPEMLKKFNYFLEFLSKYISMVISGSFFSDFPPED